ncbi:MAG: GNAT family N-acetyltransferase, partial [Alphaproteobacteria bacterium]|nr:GNAT family N-acetyltransferase [Alphaproteobacteria bacterium]
MSADLELPQRIEAVRRFSRFYTRRIGVLHEGLLGSPFSLTEGRIIWELANREQATARALGADLGLDAGYLSRILRGLEGRGVIKRRPSATDARSAVITLTPAGEAAFAALNAQSRAEIGEMLASLDAADQGRIVEAMRVIESLLGARAESRAPFILRPHRPGDIGWVVHRHAVLYAQEYGFDVTFEALVASVAAEFIQKFDPKREHCWIAEREGEIVGSVFLVRKSDEIAKLRLLYVEPKARGLGVGARLVEECMAFARSCGYRRMTLWTNGNLLAA